LPPPPIIIITHHHPSSSSEGKLKLYRRVNILVYFCDKDWKEEDEGALQFWDKDLYAKNPPQSITASTHLFAESSRCHKVQV
jgi:Rps23 Pro-64 3,4-dihydroxylase Tpa1-like proline 4-hydroxylase